MISLVTSKKTQKSSKNDFNFMINPYYSSSCFSLAALAKIGNLKFFCWGLCLKLIWLFLITIFACIGLPKYLNKIRAPGIWIKSALVNIFSCFLSVADRVVSVCHVPLGGVEPAPPRTRLGCWKATKSRRGNHKAQGNPSHQGRRR